ncbi:MULTISPECIES: DUF7006 family protein [Enterococcus]|uniref:DUF7006 family protein n=1 Tax=Enterococcus TaxID=1350 RepID=UPI0013781033|nr:MULTISPECIES: hypothetical protein [Enterococcus]NBA60754.1 hypothetical protein [Enterococcus mundtii]
MAVFTTQEAYLQGFQSTLEEVEKRESQVLKDYIQSQMNQLEKLVSQVSQENFWKVLPEILGIDAKLGIFSELIVFDDFSNEYIVRMVETDYCTYFKELCGFNLSMEPKHSMIFNVL